MSPALKQLIPTCSFPALRQEFAEPIEDGSVEDHDEHDSAEDEGEESSVEPFNHDPVVIDSDLEPELPATEPPATEPPATEPPAPTEAVVGSESQASVQETSELEALGGNQSQLAEFQEEEFQEEDGKEPAMEQQVAETESDHEHSEEQIESATQRFPDGVLSDDETPESKKVAWLQAQVVELRRLQAAQILVLN